MTPTHKPEDGDRVPISNRGAELETIATVNITDEGSVNRGARWYMRPAGYQLGTGPCDLVRRTDATALLAEKAQRIERLEAALRRIGLIEIDRDHHDPDEMIERGLSAVGQARAALSQPHPHGG
jgi:hypothetical protein